MPLPAVPSSPSASSCFSPETTGWTALPAAASRPAERQAAHTSPGAGLFTPLLPGALGPGGQFLHSVVAVPVRVLQSVTVAREELRRAACSLLKGSSQMCVAVSWGPPPRKAALTSTQNTPANSGPHSLPLAQPFAAM